MTKEKLKKVTFKDQDETRMFDTVEAPNIRVAEQMKKVAASGKIHGLSEKEIEIAQEKARQYMIKSGKFSDGSETINKPSPTPILKRNTQITRL